VRCDRKRGSAPQLALFQRAQGVRRERDPGEDAGGLQRQ